jgi:hypothetical protein
MNDKNDKFPDHAFAPADAIKEAEARRVLRAGEALAQHGHLLIAPTAEHIVQVPEQKDAEVIPVVPAAESKVDQPVQ